MIRSVDPRYNSWELDRDYNVREAVDQLARLMALLEKVAVSPPAAAPHDLYPYSVDRNTYEGLFKNLLNIMTGVLIQVSNDHSGPNDPAVLYAELQALRGRVSLVESTVNDLAMKLGTIERVLTWVSQRDF